jgi:8-amino-7-oxononanoate synthase
VAGKLEEFAGAALRNLEERGLLRVPDDGALRAGAQQAAAGRGILFVDASSNDYLGLAGSNVSRETGVQDSTAGAGASRLIHGSRRAHGELEAELAAWVGHPSALLFGSGYQANVGLLQSLGAPSSLIVSDELNHASIVDGCRLSRARVAVTPHLDVAAVDGVLAQASEATRWVVVESAFSMDGDKPDLRALKAICERRGAGLIVDEAHALGVFGPRGAGWCAEDVQTHLIMDTDQEKLRSHV